MAMAIKNIIKLVKVQAYQKKNMLFFFAGFVGTLKVLTLISTFFVKGNIHIITDINIDTLYLPLLFIPLLAIASSNILTNSELKMYPGTVRTRYISRLLTDHLFIVLSYIILLGINILCEFVILVIKHTNQNLGTCLLFDAKYWLMGFVVYVSLGSLMYMIIVLINTYASILPIIVNILIVVGVIAIWRIFPDDMEDLSGEAINFIISSNIGIGNLVFRVFLIWTIIILLGLTGTFMTKVWKEEFSKGRIFARLCINIFVCMYIIVGAFIYGNEDEYAYIPNSDGKSIYIDVPKGIDMKNYEDSGIIKHNYENTIFSINYDDYINFAEDNKLNIPYGQVYVAITADRITINNTNISKKIVDNTELDIANKKLINTKNEEYYIVNNFLGNLYKYTKEYDSTYDYYSCNYDATGFIVSATIIYK